jgi:hypothetical protein
LSDEKGKLRDDVVERICLMHQALFDGSAGASDFSRIDTFGNWYVDIEKIHNKWIVAHAFNKAQS